MNAKSYLKQVGAFTARNIRIFFKDKGTVISALIAPLVILLLYVLFLHSVLKGTFESNLVDMPITLDAKLVNGFIAAYEVSSILAVCGVTVAFIANMAMVDDRMTGAYSDLSITPAPRSVLVLGYYFATAIVTAAVCYIALAAGFCYNAAMGWGISVEDGFSIILDVLLTCLFGTAFSSIVCYFLKTRGAVNAVSTIVSTVYGFICGAYYPIAQFAKGIADFVMCLPGTYCTGLLRTHFMGGFLDKFIDAGIPTDVAAGILDSVDGRYYFFGSADPVPVWAMYLVVCLTVIALVGAFVAINVAHVRRGSKKRA